MQGSRVTDPSVPKIHKRNIILIKLNNLDEVIWTASVKRSVNYFAFAIYVYPIPDADVYFTLSNNKLNLIFGSFETEEDLDSKYDIYCKSCELNSEGANQFGSASIDIKTGEVIQKQVFLNKNNDSRENLISFNCPPNFPYAGVFKLDNNFYTHNFNSFTSKLGRINSGYLGVIELR